GDGEHIQSRPHQGSHPNPDEELNVIGEESQFAVVVPTPSGDGVSMEALSEDEDALEGERKIAHVKNQSAHYSPQPLPHSDAPDIKKQHARSDSSAGTYSAGVPAPDSGYVQARHSDGSHPTTIELFPQEKGSIDSTHNDTSLNRSPQPLLLSDDP